MAGLLLLPAFGRKYTINEMEIFDVVDRNDKVIGTATRDECHSDPNKIHRTVHFTLVDRKNKKIFLTQRSFSKPTDPGKLCFLGEHLLTGETFEEGLKRGAKEELGLDVSGFKEVHHNIFSFPTQSEFVRFFLVDWSGEFVNYDEHEIVGTKWLDLKTLVSQKNEYSDMTKFWVENTNWENDLLF